MVSDDRQHGRGIGPERRRVAARNEANRPHASAASPAVRRAAHHQADLLDRRLGDRDRRRQSAAGDHRDAVADEEDLVEVLRDDHHRRAVLGHFGQRAMDRRRRAGVDAPGRLIDRPASTAICMISRPTRNFCRLPPDSERACGLRAGGAHVEALDDLAGEFERPAAPHEAEARQRPARRRRSGSRCRTASSARPRRGRCAPRGRSSRRAPRRSRGPIWPTATPSRRIVSGLPAGISPDSASISSFWPLPAMPATPRISPGATAKLTCFRSAPNGLGEAIVSRSTTRRGGAARSTTRRLRRRRLELGGDHQLGELLGRFLARIAMGDDAAEPHDRRGVAERANLLELVADVEDRAAFGGEPAQGREQRLRLLRRQHRGRLVHDQQLRLLQQAAHDLDALALADREIVHGAIGVERQAVFARRLDDALAQVDAFARRR